MNLHCCSSTEVLSVNEGTLYLLVEDGGINGGLAVGNGGEGWKGGREVTTGTGGFLTGPSYPLLGGTNGGLQR